IHFSAASGVTQHVTGSGTVNLFGWGGGNDVYLRQVTASHIVQFASGITMSAGNVTNTGLYSNTIGDLNSGGLSGTWDNFGTWTANGSGNVLSFSSGTFTNEANAFWAADSGGTLNVTGTWHNSGTLRAVGTLNLNGTYDNTNALTINGG